MKIFVSSTMEDLTYERKIVADAIKECGYEPILAEEYRGNLKPETPEKVVNDMADKADAYIGIFDKRWGYEPPSNNPPQDIQKYIKSWNTNDKLSVTAIEYYYARKKDIPIIIFVSKNEDDREPKLKEFLNAIGDYHEGIFYYKYGDRFDLYSKARKLINKLINKDLQEFLEYQMRYFEEKDVNDKALKDYYVIPTLVKCKMSSWCKEKLTNEDIISKWTIDEFLKSNNWLTIIGADSEMGKTSYCKYIASYLAEKYLEDADGYVPIFIDLKNGFYNNNIYYDFTIEQLLDLDLLKEKKKLLIIDAWDEYKEEGLDKLSETLREYGKTCKVLLTTELKKEYKGIFNKDEYVRILPFNEEQIKEVIERYGSDISYDIFEELDIDVSKPYDLWIYVATRAKNCLSKINRMRNSKLEDKDKAIEVLTVNKVLEVNREHDSR